ncbi:MAG: carotenoid 1,2-hydratase, partial [Aliifodinibius sp.]|nr:lipocalin family protein [candidate division Zixibacteria bacterium]NIT54808.1 lipocalin family protein [Fodinibius sp.]NIV09848.1 carotenoid 1,2-hydratase [Fodinibius sp.]NIY23392.1 carotenoid 1,2-hydratase [Fodinibius sp.]
DSGVEYPAAWSVQIPSLNLEMEIQPYMANQEMNVSYIYWEGAVQVSGERNGQSVAGNGYVEMTGYARSMQEDF